MIENLSLSRNDLTVRKRDLAAAFQGPEDLYKELFPAGDIFAPAAVALVAADGAHMKRQLEIRQSVRVRSADDLDFSHDFLSFASIVIKMHQKCYFCF